MTFLPIALNANLVEISGYCGKDGENIKWTVNTVDSTLVFDGIGEMASYGSYNQPWASYKSYVKYVSIKEGILNVTDYAFYNMSIVSVEIPKTLTCIGNYSMAMCKKLKSCSLPENITRICPYAFCASGIERIIIPSTINTIEDGTFMNCTELYEAILPENLVNIGYNSFSGCSVLSAITLPTTLTSIGNNAFQDCTILTAVSLPENLNSIGSGAFRNSGLNSIIIPASITQLENSTFDGCKQMESVNLGKNIFSIGNNCFRGCTSLKLLSLPLHLSTLNRFAFSGCTSLEEVVVEGEYSYIGDYTFSGCSSLTKVVLPDGFTDAYFGKYVFDGCDALSPLYNSTTFFYMPKNGTVSFTVPEGITTIAKCAFYGNATIKHIELPPTINMFGEYAFAMSKIEELDLSNLEYVALGEGCFSNSSIKYFISPTKIANCPQNAFDGCKGLTELDLSGFTKVPGWIYVGNLGIGSYAFRNCENLKHISLPDIEERLDIGNSAFQNCYSLEMFDFSSVGTIYQNAFANCKSLKKVEISNFGRSQIGTYIFSGAFAGCEGLDSVVIGSSGLQQFYMSTFTGCINLKSVVFNSEIIPKIADLGSSPYNGLLDKDFSDFNLPYFNTTFSIFGYLADGCLVGNDQEFWKKVTIERIFEDLSGECGDQGGNITWSLNTQEGVLRLVGSGNMKFPEDKEILTWKDRSKSVKEIILADNIETICPEAFYGCAVKTIKLNKSLKSIGTYAFYACSLETIEFNSSLEYIDSWAFGSCSSLQKVVLNEGLKGTGNSIFYWCSALNEAILPSSLTNIGEAIFGECTNLKSVTLPKRIATIPKYTFSGCKNLTNIYIPAIVPPSVTGYGNDQIRRDDITIHIPQGTTDKYKSSVLWNLYQTDEYYAYVSLEKNNGGAFTIGDDEVTAAKWDDYLILGQSFSVELVPDNYYKIQNVTVNGVETNIENNKLNFETLQENKEIIVTFAPCDYLLSLSVSGKGHVSLMGYDVEISGKFRINYEDEIDIEFVPNEMSNLKSVICNGSDITNAVIDGKYSIKNPTCDIEMKVSFAQPEISGDVNGDGAVDIADAVCIVNYILGMATPTFIETAADVNGDGEVDIADAVKIVNNVVGKSDQGSVLK